MGASVVEYQDLLLTKLVASANKELKLSITMHLTLFVKGHMIVGELISGNEYYESLGNEIIKNPSAEATRLAHEMFLKGQKTYKAYNGESFEDPETAYIHMKNVKILTRRARSYRKV